MITFKVLLATLLMPWALDSHIFRHVNLGLSYSSFGLLRLSCCFYCLLTTCFLFISVFEVKLNLCAELSLDNSQTLS